MKLSTAGLQIMNDETTETKTRDYRKRNRILYIIEAAFTLLYVTPFFPASSTAKTVIFTALILIGFALNNVANPPKTDRFMKSVDKDKRGVFTANKEIASLISGMAFSLLLGRLYRAVVLDVISRFERARRRQTDGYRRYFCVFRP